MIVCPYCAHKNREGFLFCEDCGQALNGSNSPTTLPTRKLDPSAADLAARATWGTARFAQEAAVVMHIRDAAEPLVLQPPKKIVIGRSDSTSTQNPDLDLTPYNALEKGVSRIHAVILRSEDTLSIMDMGSINGTYLNGTRLLADQPRVLRDGDEIRFGKLVAHVYFK
jgi:hypothetical protein